MGSSIKYVRKIFRKTHILTSWYVHVRVRIRGLEILVFRKILRTYLMDDPYSESCQTFKKELLAKIVDDFYLLTIFIKNSTLDIWLDVCLSSGCVFD